MVKQLRLSADGRRRSDRGDWLANMCESLDEEMVLRLVAQAMLLQGNTVANECFHACLRRVLKYRVQTHGIKVEDLSAEKVGITSRNRQPPENQTTEEACVSP